MSNQMIQLHPRNYKEVKDRLIFYLDKNWINQNEYESVLEELLKVKTLVVTSYRKNEERNRKYTLYIGKYCVQFSESTTGNIDFYSSRIISGKKVAEKKKNLYKTKVFTIIPSGGVFVIYNEQIVPASENPQENSWSMDEEVYNELVQQMENYFDHEDVEEEVKQEKIVIRDRFRKNVLKPFRDYTDKEDWVERFNQAQGEGVSYYKRVYKSKNEKGSVYDFYSKDINADPEKHFLSEGSRVTIIDEANGNGVYTGIVQAMDDESEEDIIISIAFFHQTDDADFPKQGKLVLTVNDTQTKVRAKVIRNMERKRIESTYMYRTFNDFSVAGYENPKADLAAYLAGKMKDEFPPNQMQMEAIIKGILTKDLLLVLGPPGTGKTTVISQWVEYFISQGQRVLISSQNNAAVDNVLARFKGKGEIVRLGNEDKVQEECKEFLPHNKLGTMRKVFLDNKERLNRQLTHDKQQIVSYMARLKEGSAISENYVKNFEKCRSAMRAVAEQMRELDSKHKILIQVEMEIEEIIEQRAHKRIFLEEAARKNLLVRFFNRKYVEHVKEELEQSDEQLKISQLKYQAAILEYNNCVVSIKKLMENMRAQKIISIMEESGQALRQYREGKILKNDFCPVFESEIKAHYMPVRYVNDDMENHKLLKSEQKKMDELEIRIKKLEFALDEWHASVNSERNDIMQNVLLETCQIVGATCIGINSNKDFAKVKFDVSIVDESGQIQIHNALIPMSRARKNLLLGDYKQIPPCANDQVVAACVQEEIDTDLLNKSFFEYLFESMKKRVIKELEDAGEDKSKLLKPVLADYEPKKYKNFSENQLEEQMRLMIEAVTSDGKKLVNLNSQFRMPGNISNLISEWFYENNYFSSYDMKRFSAMVPGTDKPMVVINTAGSKRRGESQPNNKMGYLNQLEAKLVADIVEQVIMSQPKETRKAFCRDIEHNIGIISAYGAQVRTIRECLSKRKLDIDNKQIRSMVASLDSFQGQERPLILYSLTRSTNNNNSNYGRVGFMKELRRLNVAFTRCQKQLVILGDVDYLCNCMKMERKKDENDNIVEWPCETQAENFTVGQAEIEQCAECTASCERKFARFMRLLMQHVKAGDGNLIEVEDFYLSKGKCNK